MILDKIDYEPKLITRDIDDRFQYKISYAKVWRAKQKVFEMRFGTYEASYDNLPQMVSAIVQRNPESRLIRTLSRVYLGDLGFCFVLSSALVHV